MGISWQRARRFERHLMIYLIVQVLMVTCALAAGAIHAAAAAVLVGSSLGLAAHLTRLRQHHGQSEGTNPPRA